jgi:transposase
VVTDCRVSARGEFHRSAAGMADVRIVNAIFYFLRGGIAWRLLPKDFPPWRIMTIGRRQWARGS